MSQKSDELISETSDDSDGFLIDENEELLVAPSNRNNDMVSLSSLCSTGKLQVHKWINK